MNETLFGITPIAITIVALVKTVLHIKMRGML